MSDTFTTFRALPIYAALSDEAVRAIAAAADQATPVATQLPLPVEPVRLFHDRLNAWLDKLTELSPEGYSYDIDPPRRGQRFARIVMSAHGQRSVHAFYDLRTGDVYKAAGWRVPAKHVRYRLLDDESFATMMAHLDWPGRYLYIR